MQTRTRKMAGLLMVVLAGILPVRANDINVGNIGWENVGDGESYVTFDLSWSNSWRAGWTELADNNVSGSDLPVENWDAAWVFIKYRPTGSSSAYAHATLSTNALSHLVPPAAGGVAMTCTVGRTAGRPANDGATPGEGVGVFIYREGNGHGPVAIQNVKLRWRHGADGVANADAVDLQVHAIEMVYVDQGPFALGTGGSEDSRFYKADATSEPFIVSGEGTITLQNSGAGNLWAAANIMASGSVLPNAWPKGHNAFYCMKYSITQGQYAEFLNAIGDDAAFRYRARMTFRHTVTNDNGTYSASSPYVACNFISWWDGAMYASWAGLRPMTELEYEKACRGPRKPEANEYAWGSTSLTRATGIANPGEANEAATPGGANAVVGNAANVQGPMRVGVFAGPNTTRQESGASYWGIMEMSGNLWEPAITVARTESLAFQGTHGSGTLTPPGDWPGANAHGSGLRGGCWRLSQDFRVAVSARRSPEINAGSASRDEFNGWRAVRSAP